MGGCSTNTGARESTVIAGKSRLTGVLAAENAARVRTTPSEAASDPPIKAEVWRVPTQNNTSQQAILPGQFEGVFEGQGQLVREQIRVRRYYMGDTKERSRYAPQI
jgi:hypothetical protein